MKFQWDTCCFSSRSSSYKPVCPDWQALLKPLTVNGKPSNNFSLVTNKSNFSNPFMHVQSWMWHKNWLYITEICNNKMPAKHQAHHSLLFKLHNGGFYSINPKYASGRNVKHLSGNTNGSITSIYKLLQNDQPWLALQIDYLSAVKQ